MEERKWALLKVKKGRKKSGVHCTVLEWPLTSVENKNYKYLNIKCHFIGGIKT